MRRVSVTGSFFGNEKCGIMISNSDTVSISKAEVVSNGQYGILFQGKNGGSECLISECEIYDNFTNIAEIHGSRDNIFVAVKDGDKLHFFSGNPKGTGLSQDRNESEENANIEIHPKIATAQEKDLETGPAYSGRCGVCGKSVKFQRYKQSVREGYRCPVCKSSTRYRSQAQALLTALEIDFHSITVMDLKSHFTISQKHVYEPGIIGPFRKYIESAAANYEKSYYWPDIELGIFRDGIRNENLEDLTFESESFDLVITSNIFEHVRKPLIAFMEVSRVLKPGGAHIFTVPALLPLRRKTVYRVETTGSEDIMIMEPAYHIAGNGDKSLVYTEIGQDLFEEVEHLTGDRIQVLQFCPESADAPEDVFRIVSFIQWKNSEK